MQLKYADQPADYFTATWLYGTDQLPASYVATWAPRYLVRAKALYEKTAEVQSSPTGAVESSSEHSSDESLDDEEEESSTKSGASAATRSAAALAVMLAAAVFV
ncbi:hypothetical protein GGI15_002257 [Coemansia interrupta]|uniref:Uncharacterized protein n=1 Tax=Coemansia interrupta TaxID=1126814 RepID=A0A9W8HKQ0_9FUNG|nr:hypothetical protein GGI15_002257 [Coemansia interrupta]